MGAPAVPMKGLPSLSVRSDTGLLRQGTALRTAQRCGFVAAMRWRAPASHISPLFR